MYLLWLMFISLALWWNPLLSPVIAEVVESQQIFDKIGATGKSNEGMSIRNFSSERVLGEDGKMSLLWKIQNKYEFSQILKPETGVIVIAKEGPGYKNPPLNSNGIFDELEPQLRIFNLKQKSDGFSFGVGYRSIGKDMTNPNDYKKVTETNAKLESDQEGIGIWGSKKLGPVDLKVFFDKFWDNVDRDSQRPRMLRNQGGIAMSSKVPVLPLYLSFSYAQGTSESTMEPEGFKPQGSRNQTFGGSMYYYGGQTFDMTFSSSYSPSRDQVNLGQKTEAFWHEISSSIRPTWKVTITPTLSFGEYKYLWYGERTRNPSASLSLNYSQLFDAIDLDLWGYYSRTAGTDGYQDAKTLGISLKTSWTGKYLVLPNSKFYIKFGYDKYIDKIYPDISCGGPSVGFGLELKF